MKNKRKNVAAKLAGKTSIGCFGSFLKMMNDACNSVHHRTGISVDKSDLLEELCESGTFFKDLAGAKAKRMGWVIRIRLEILDPNSSRTVEYTCSTLKKSKVSESAQNKSSVHNDQGELL